MNKVLLIGDPHFKVSNSLETSQFSKETLDYVSKNKEKLDYVVILGDTLDTHEKIHVLPFCRATDFITELSKIILVYVIIGNHDRINNNIFLTEEHPFTGLKNNKNIIIVDKVLKKDNVIFVPYVPNGRFEEALATVDFDQNKTEIIFAHQEFRGCKMGALISETGDVWPENFPTVFSGHIHDFQTPQKNILYTGTPFQHGFGDSDDKFLVLLNFTDRKTWDIEKIYIDVIKKKTISVNICDLEDFKIPENYIIKLVIIGDPVTCNLILSKKSVQDKLKKYNIQYRTKNPDIKLKNRESKVSSSSFLEIIETKIKIESEEVRKIFKEIISN